MAVFRNMNPVFAFILIIILCSALKAVAADGAISFDAGLFPKIDDVLKRKIIPKPVVIEVNEGLPEDLHFTIPIPSREWKTLPREAMESGGERLAGFVHPSGPKFGLIQIVKCLLDYEVSTNDWFLWTCEKAGMNILGFKSRPTSYGSLFEAFAVTKLPEGSVDQPIVMRAAIIRSGVNLLLVKCTASAKAYLRLIRQFAVATNLFSLKNPSIPVPFGQWSRRTLSAISYSAPAFEPEKVEHESPEIEEEVFKLNRRGILYVRVINPVRVNAETRFKSIVESLTNYYGYKFDNDSRVAYSGSHFNGADLEYFKIHGTRLDDGQKVDLFAVTLESGQKAVLSFLLCDDRTVDPLVWLINKGTFEAVSRSLTFN